MFAAFCVAVLFIYFQVRGLKTPEEYSPIPSDDEDYSDYVQISDMPDDATLHEFLLGNFAFYHLLNSQEKALFRTRLVRIIKTKWFVGREGMQITDSKILLIGATMAQLTMGIERFYFPRFDRIVLFPNQFYSRLFEQDVKGLTVYHNGIVILSWPHYEDGYSDATDKLNLGLHEMAHALYLDYFGHRRMLYGFDDWTLIALPVFEEMQRNEHHPFLRDYARSNIHEFWAVCIEHFFEAPVEFRQKLPDLYRAMCQILRQDHAKRIEAFAVSRRKQVT
jgi:Mlc titration factor MtfA (ptsG expression regulator)